MENHIDGSNIIEISQRNELVDDVHNVENRVEDFVEEVVAPGAGVAVAAAAAINVNNQHQSGFEQN